MFQRKLIESNGLNVTSVFLFQNLHSTLCKGISWQVNLSRLDFPWILRWCYFTSLSHACILNFLCVYSFIPALIPSNTPCYGKIVKSNTAFPPLSFSSESCSAANSTKLCSAPAEKSRKETDGNPYWMVLVSNSTKPAKALYDLFDLLDIPIPIRHPGQWWVLTPSNGLL